MPRYLDYEGRKKLRAWIRGNFLGKTERAADAALLGGKPPEYYAGPPVNLLDNSNFRNPVNGRGSANISAQYGYPIDRWMFDKNGSGTGAGYDADNKYLYIANNATDGSWGALYQGVPAEKIPTGTYTLAFHEKLIAPISLLCLVDDTTTVLPSAQYAPNGDGLVIATFNIQTAPSHKLLIAVYAEQGNTVSFDWAALYEGTYTADTLPPYTPRPYSVELAECQRYYQPPYTRMVQAYFDGFAPLIPLFAVMRTTPTITDISVKDIGGGEMAASILGGTTPYSCGVISVPSAVGGQWLYVTFAASAEL